MLSYLSHKNAIALFCCHHYLIWRWRPAWWTQSILTFDYAAEKWGPINPARRNIVYPRLSAGSDLHRTKVQWNFLTTFWLSTISSVIPVPIRTVDDRHLWKKQRGSIRTKILRPSNTQGSGLLVEPHCSCCVSESAEINVLPDSGFLSCRLAEQCQRQRTYY